MSRTRSAGVMDFQSLTWRFQVPGGRGSLRWFEPSRLTRAIEPSLVLLFIAFSASRDPSGDQWALTDRPGWNATGISRRLRHRDP